MRHILRRGSPKYRSNQFSLFKTGLNIQGQSLIKELVAHAMQQPLCKQLKPSMHITNLMEHTLNYLFNKSLTVLILELMAAWGAGFILAFSLYKILDFELISNIPIVVKNSHANIKTVQSIYKAIFQLLTTVIR